MSSAPETGSARRKGDDYQDLTALRLALEHYIARTPFTMHLEFENSGNLDDIVFMHGNHIDAYQVRYSVSPLALYHFDDLTDSTSRVYLPKFSQSWAKLRDRFPEHRLKACLWTTRSLDAQIVDLVTPTGTFQPAVVEDRRRGTAKQLRSRLSTAAALDPETFRAFLSDFQFLARRPTLADLEQYIRAVLLDQKLGFSDPAVFFRLKDVIQEHAVLSHDPITPDLLDTLFARFHTKLFVPQVFPVDRESLVDRTSFSRQLDNSLPRADGTYLLITGLPGSGKSTALTAYFDALDLGAYEVFRYYCFVGVNDNLQNLRIRAQTFHANLLEAFHRRYPYLLERRFDYSQSNFLDSLRVLASSLWQKSIDRSRPESTEWRRLGGMAMGKKPAARQPSPMWVTTADLPTSAGHPFFERLNRVLEEAGFDAFVEGLCAVFYASRLGRPSLRPGRYFRLLFIGYFEGLSSERGIAWRVADSLSLRAFLDLDVTEAPPNHSTLSRTRRLIDVETHVAVFTWVLERLAGAGLVQGKTVGVDATTLEANAAMRSIERRDTGESYEAFVRQLAKASGIETPTRAELARFDRSRKDRKTSNKEWQSPQDTDAKIAKMKDGRTHLAHKAEHGIDLETGAILSVTVQEASEGDSATLPATLTMAAEQVEAVQPAGGAEVEEVVADKGYHSDATLVALDEIGVRSYVSEPERGRRCWQDKKTGETPAEKRAAQKALYGNRRRIRGDRGRRLQRRRGELVERPFAHQYETGGLRRVWVRGHENVRKRVLIQAAGCNLGLLLRQLTGVGTPRSLQGRALSAICGLIGRLTALWGRLTASWDFQWTPAGLVGSIAHRQAA